MTSVGIVGLGFMGMVHYLTYQRLPGVKVVAICDQNKRRLSGDWTDIKGNFGPAGEQMDLSQVATHESLDAMLADPNIDLVDVTLPPSLHAEAVIKALSAGKHVFCEKPLAMNPEDCERMVAARPADRQLLVGHVLPFYPEYAWAMSAIRSGEFGKLLGGSFRRVISDPTWLPLFWDANAVGGPMLDLHVHDAHFIRLAFGMPTEITTRGSQRNGLPEHWHSILEFDDENLVVHVEGGVVNQQGRPFLHGFEIHFEQATLLFEFAVMGDDVAYLCPPTLLDAEGKAQRVELGSGDPMDAFLAEIQHVLRVVQGEAEPDALRCDLARDAIELCHRQAENLSKRGTHS